MTGTTPGLVDIVRDFLAVDQAMRSLFERFQCGALRFEEVRDRFSADEGSALFRLKERCHALFRVDADAPQAARPREVLFAAYRRVWPASCRRRRCCLGRW